MGKNQWSLLHIIAECKNIHLYQYLINRLDEKNPKTNEGVTPLFIAASKGYFEVCKLIIENVADKNPATNND